MHLLWLSLLTFSWCPMSGLCHVSILIRKLSFIYSFCREETNNGWEKRGIILQHIVQEDTKMSSTFKAAFSSPTHTPTHTHSWRCCVTFLSQLSGEPTHSACIKACCSPLLCRFLNCFKQTKIKRDTHGDDCRVKRGKVKEETERKSKWIQLKNIWGNVTFAAMWIV